MGCIKASDYIANSGTATILGTYTGPDPSGDCEQDCGICCKWICPTITGEATKDLLALGIYNEEDLLPTGNWDPSLYSYNVYASCFVSQPSLLFSSIPTGTWYVKDGAAFPILESPPSLELSYNTYIFNSGYPRTSNNWLIGYFSRKGYSAQKFCDNGVVQNIDEEFGTFEARYFECISGEISDVTSDALSTFDIVFFNTGENQIPPGIEDPGRYPENIVQNNPVIGTNINYSYHEYVDNPDNGDFTSVVSTGFYSINSIPDSPCLCIDYEPEGPTTAITTPPNTTIQPEQPSGNACIDFRNFSSDISGCDINWPSGEVMSYECDEEITKSGCIYGGVDSPTGVALGIWFVGLNCDIANSGYGGCSGLANM